MQPNDLSESRRARPCKYCRKRRIACERASGSSDACRRCSQKGLVCEYDDPPPTVKTEERREENDDAAIRAQLQRLEMILDRFERRPGYSAYSDPPHEVEIDDIVASMTSMVLSVKGMTPAGSPGELEEEVRQALDGDESVESELTETGFVLQQQSEPISPYASLTLEEMVARLPPWTDTMHIIMVVFPKLWICHRNALLSPAFPLRVEKVYRESKPAPAALAEIFAVLAATYSCLAVRHGDETLEYTRLQKVADDHIGNAKRCLELAQYIEFPSILSVRAIHLLSISMICCAKETRMFNRALALLPLAVAGVYRMGLDREDAEMLAQETPTETYERRGLVNAVLREDVYFGLVYQGHATASWARLECPTAGFLEDDDLPPGQRQSPYRVSPLLFKALSLRLPFATTRRETLKVLSAKKGMADYSRIRELSRKIDQIEEQMPAEWRLEPGKAIPVITDLPSRTQRFLMMPAVWQLRILLHRPFLGYRKPSAGLTEEDLQWHRDETLKACWQLQTTLKEDVYEVCGKYVAVTYTCFDSVIAALIVLALEPEHHLADSVRRLCIHYTDICASKQAPPVLRRLSRLLSYLLDKPRTLVETQGGGATKRAKIGRSNVARRRPARSYCRTGAPASSFDFTVPLTSPMLAATSSEEDELPHLTATHPQPSGVVVPSNLLDDDLKLLEDLQETSLFGPFDLSLPYLSSDYYRDDDLL